MPTKPIPLFVQLTEAELENAALKAKLKYSRDLLRLACDAITDFNGDKETLIDAIKRIQNEKQEALSAADLNRQA